jgi:hypothetical protein
MTPKEKAIDLIRKFNTNDNYDFLGGVRRAKQCAIIAVDEIILAITFNMYDEDAYKKEDNYWQQVKQEIEKA